MERSQEQMNADYKRYRGKCQEMCAAAIASDPSLILVRGHYFDTFWGMQAHWWTVRSDGTIYDPTALQFPSAGNGHYEPFDGICTCAECGENVKEEEAIIIGNGHYAMCSNKCALRFVGCE